MNNDNSIDWLDVEVGDELQYEEKYDLQAYVTVLNKKVKNDEGNPDYIEFELRLDEIKGGKIADCFSERDHLTVGKSLSEGQYLTAKNKFKPRGSQFDYRFLKEVNDE